MQLPLVAPAPVVVEHAQVFRELFENRCQFQHFENYLTGLMVLANKSMANISRCLLESADKTNLSRFFSEAPWEQAKVNEKRITYMLEQTAKVRRKAAQSCVIVDDTLCEHVGSMFEYVDRHYDHCEGRYPLGHNLVTTHYVSGVVRFPLEVRLYRRYEEQTRWEEFVRKHYPAREIPTEPKGRTRLHKEVDPTLLQDAEFKALHEQFRTKIALAIELLTYAVEHAIPFQTVLMDSWFLCAEVAEELAKLQKDWVSLLKKNRNLEVNSFTLRDAYGQKVAIEGAHIKVEDLVPLIPPSAYTKVTIGEREYWYFALNLRVPGLGKVRLVMSFGNAELTGTSAVLVSNRTDWSAKKILETYVQRWPIETFYQDSKGHLGLDEYRMRTAAAIKKHWCLVFVAYSFLHLQCLAASPKKGRASTHPIKTIGEACRQQGQALIEKLILYAHALLQRGQSAATVFAEIFAKQQAVPAL
jgi:SRSO17 transposase